MADMRSAFELLTKRKVFVLAYYGEQYHIAFSFSPNTVAQFHATILVTTMGMNPEVRWAFPVIGNTLLGNENELPPIRGRAGETITQILQFPLVGEQEVLNGEDYTLTIEYPDGFDWLRALVTFQPFVLIRSALTPILEVTLSVAPRKPLKQTLQAIVENPIGQKWKFALKTVISQAAIMKTLLIESPLNVETAKRIVVDEPIRQRTPFTAHLAPGSKPEFRVTPDKGVIEASLRASNELPVEVLFKPTTYGKAVRGVLVIDTIDVQYVIELQGRLPEYIPPIILHSGMINTDITDSARSLRASLSARKLRNIIRDNINSVKLTRPKTTRVSHGGRRPFLI
jgi:hypothetical protein